MTAPYVPLVVGDVWGPERWTPPWQFRTVSAVTSDGVTYSTPLNSACNILSTCTWTEWREWVERTGATVRESGQ